MDLQADTLYSLELEEYLEELIEDETCSEDVDTLQAVCDEGRNYSPDWLMGCTLVSEDYFETYTQELVADCYDLELDSWPLTCIDWSRATEELQQDHTPIEVDGSTYYVL